MHLEALPRRNQRRKRKFYHEGHEEHEVKKFKNINVRNLRVLRVLRGDTVFLIQEVRNDAPENLRRLHVMTNMLVLIFG
jgi:hypothetical protein